MMMGTSHGWSGLMAGAITLPVAPVDDPQGQLAWVAAWGGMALLPDADQGGYSMQGLRLKGNGSTIARMWGPITLTMSAGIGKVARGHRNGTHDAVLSPLAFGGLAALAALHPVGAFVVLAFAVGAALHACEELIPGKAEKWWPTNLGISLVAAAYLTNGGGIVDPGVLPGAALDLDFAWLPFAVAGGVLVHIVGDALTVGGVPVPFTWLDGKAERVSLGLFRTGAWQEKVLAPCFLLVAVLFAAQHSGLRAFVEDTVVPAMVAL